MHHPMTSSKTSSTMTSSTPWAVAAFTLLLGVSYSSAAVAQSAESGSGDGAPLVIAKQGSFFVNGQLVHAPVNFGEPSETWIPGKVVINHMYVQYQIPANRSHPLPVIMVHGGGHTGKTYEETPDGRDGWGTHFVRRGFATYIVDDPNRGRSGYDVTSTNLARQGLAPLTDIPLISRYAAERAWVAFRFGPEFGVPYPGLQFPIEAAEQYYAQLVSTYRNPEEIDKITAALIALVDSIGPAILMLHSQSGGPGMLTAEARPDLVKAVINVEGSCAITEDALKSAWTRVRLLTVAGDFREPADEEACRTTMRSINDAGGHALHISLPERGFHGNSHMMMIEKNNLEIANWLIGWIHLNVP
jgi:pimeloyl-ACP methyl ester carboxylesterase